MQTILDLGVDVDSRYLVIAYADCSLAVQRIANERSAIVAWLREVPHGSRLGVEATGDYHELLADLAHAAGLFREKRVHSRRQLLANAVMAARRVAA